MQPLFSNNQTSYYHRSYGQILDKHQALDHNEKTQLVIVGGGMTGLSTALHAAKAGIDVILLEGRRIANGASSVNGGLIVPNTAASANALKMLYGEDHAQTYVDLARHAVAYVPHLIADLGIACDLGQGILRPAGSYREMLALEAGVRSLQNDFRYDDLKLVNKDEVAAITKSNRYSGGVLQLATPHLDPLKFSLGVARAAADAGARIFENSEVAFVRSGNGKFEIQTMDDHIVYADQLLLATNMDNGRLHRPLGNRVVKVYGAMIGSAPLPPDFPILRPGMPVWEKPGAAAFKRVADGSFLFGGATLTCVNNALARRALVKAARRYFPQLADVDFPYVWGGAVAAGRHFDLPDIGEVAHNYHYAQRMTFSWAPYFGKMFVDALLGDDREYRFLESFPKQDLPFMPALQSIAGFASHCAGLVAAI